LSWFPPPPCKSRPQCNLPYPPFSDTLGVACFCMGSSYDSGNGFALLVPPHPLFSWKDPPFHRFFSRFSFSIPQLLPWSGPCTVFLSSLPYPTQIFPLSGARLVAFATSFFFLNLKSPFPRVWKHGRSRLLCPRPFPLRLSPVPPLFPFTT